MQQPESEGLGHWKPEGLGHWKPEPGPVTAFAPGHRKGCRDRYHQNILSECLPLVSAAQPVAKRGT